MRLPTYANNVLPSGVRADYVNERRIKSFRINGPSNANQHRGHLEGWEQLRLGGLTANSEWVRMHLFTHRFGGQPTDSNLVPAEGPTTNKAMTGLEEHVDAEIKGGKTIWYEVKVGLGHTVNIPSTFRPAFNLSPTQNYMNSLTARWGTYTPKPGGGGFTEKEESPKVVKGPGAPRFPVAGATIGLADIHTIGEGPLTSLMGSPFTLWVVRGLRIAINKMREGGDRATSTTNLDTKLRALPAPHTYKMSADMKARLIELSKGGQITF
jgi:hypothetical protein